MRTTDGRVAILDGVLRFEQGYALIIAIDRYLEHGQLASLERSVANDGVDVANLLCDPKRCGYLGSRVRVLRGDLATILAIRDALTWLAHETEIKDTVFIYFSGHGIRLGHADQRTSFLAPYDASPANGENLLSKEEFESALNRIRAARMTVVLDCCHADANAPAGPQEQVGEADQGFSSGLAEEDMESLSVGGGRVVFSACRPEQRAWTLNSYRNSLFTHFLLAGLRGQAAGRFNPLAAIGSFMVISLGAASRFLSRYRSQPWQGLGSVLNRLRERLLEAGWGTIRIFQLFEFVRREVRKAAAQAGFEQSPRLYSQIDDNFPLARLPVHFGLVGGALMMPAIILLLGWLWIYAPESCGNPRLVVEQLNGLNWSAGSVVIDRPETLTARVVCLPAEGLPLVVEARPYQAESDAWVRVGAKHVEEEGALRLKLQVPESAVSAERIGELRAMLRTGAASGDPGCRSYRLHQFRLGRLEWADFEETESDAQGDIKAVPPQISLEGSASHLEGMKVEILSRPMCGRNRPAQRRAVARIIDGKWSGREVPVREKYDDCGHFQIWAQVSRRPEFLTRRAQVRVRPSSTRILSVNGLPVSEDGEMLLDARSNLEISGKAMDFLPGERVWIAVLKREEGKNRALDGDHSAEIRGDGSWSCTLSVPSASEFLLYSRIWHSRIEENDLEKAHGPVRVRVPQKRRQEGGAS